MKVFAFVFIAFLGLNAGIAVAQDEATTPKTTTITRIQDLVNRSALEEFIRSCRENRPPCFQKSTELPAWLEDIPADTDVVFVFPRSSENLNIASQIATAADEFAAAATFNNTTLLRLGNGFERGIRASGLEGGQPFTFPKSQLTTPTGARALEGALKRIGKDGGLVINFGGVDWKGCDGPLVDCLPPGWND